MRRACFQPVPWNSMVNTKEIILRVRLLHILFKASRTIREPFAKVVLYFLSPTWIHSKQWIYYLFRYLLWSVRVASDAHASKSSSEAIIRDITLEKSILHIRSDALVKMRSVRDASKRIVSHDLIAHGV
jgi:hypothetical protein